MHYFQKQKQGELIGKLFYLDESRYFYTRLQNQTKDAADAKKQGSKAV